MRWPWATRDDVDRWITATGRITDANADLVRMVERERDRYDTLLEKFTALRLAGGDVAPLTTAPVVRARAEPDPVTQAIISKAKHSLLLRKHYAEYVRRERAKGAEEMDIAQAILDGHSDDEEMVFG